MHMLEQFSRVADGALSRVRKTKSGPTDRYLVALDVGTENVKALIGKINGTSVDIIGIGRAHQGLSDMQAGAVADIAAVTATKHWL